LGKSGPDVGFLQQFLYLHLNFHTKLLDGCHTVSQVPGHIILHPRKKLHTQIPCSFLDIFMTNKLQGIALKMLNPSKPVMI
jgi:hypothetical protein